MNIAYFRYTIQNNIGYRLKRIAPYSLCPYQTMPDKKPRKRNRVPISCVICRRRKVKCDKQKPQCLNCIKNNVQHLCHYLEPKWAQPLPNEKDFPQAPIDNDDNTNTPANIDNANAVTTINLQLQKDLDLLKNKIKSLESENSDLKRKMLTATSTTSSNTKNTNTTTTTNQSTVKIKPDNDDDSFDAIFNSNILFISPKNNKFNIPITYQISIFSWMFIVKNDIYLNDLWLKILKLRQQYEYYYNSKHMDISRYNKNYNNNKSISNGNSSIKNKNVMDSRNNNNRNNNNNNTNSVYTQHTSKLKKFLENSLSLQSTASNEIEISTGTSSSSNSKLPNVCPVTGVIGVCPIGNNLATPTTATALATTVNGPSGTPKSTTPKCPIVNTNDLYEELAISDSKSSTACPLILNDGKALFREKLSKMNLSSLRDSPNPPTPLGKKRSFAASSPAKSKGAPVIPSGPSTPMSEIKPQDNEKLNNFVPIAMKPESRQNSKRKLNDTGTPPTFASSNNNNHNSNKKLKSSLNIKLINYNNTKQIINIVEQYLPNKKVVLLLIERFFDKLYINLPYIDEYEFKAKINTILKLNDVTNQRIKLSIGFQYCDDFLTLCLCLIIIRLSWLTLPTEKSSSLTQNELILMKPENFISFVLIDLVKEIFTNSKVMSKPSIIIFQIGLFLKIYSTISPEDGFDTDDSYTKNNNCNINDLPGDLSNESPNMNSSNFISMLVQLAYTIGLNRDPLNFKNFYPNSNDNKLKISKLFKQRHLWRKLWYGLIFLTIETNFSLSDYHKNLPIEIEIDPTFADNNRSWDCRLPGGIEQGILENSFENGKVLQRELCIVQNFRESINSYRWIFKGMKLLFSVDKPASSKDLENILSKLNEIVVDNSKFGFGIDLILSDKEIVNPFRARNSTVWVKKYTIQIKIMRLKVYLIVKNMIFSLNYLLFLNHEHKFSKLLNQKNSTFEKIEIQRQYIEKFFENCLLVSIENFKLFLRLIDNNKNSTTNNADGPNNNNGSNANESHENSRNLLIIPYLLILNHRSYEFLISLVLRIQQNSPVIIEILKKNKINLNDLLKRLFNYLELFIEKLEFLTKYYYYAYILKRLVKFFYNILTNSEKLFKLNFKNMSIDQKDETQQQQQPQPQQLEHQQHQQQQQQHRHQHQQQQQHQQQRQQQQQQQPQQHRKQQQAPQPQLQQLQHQHQQHPPQRHIKQEHQRHIKQEPQQNIKHEHQGTEALQPHSKSAFEIAFGTSKLPPVTDYNDNNNNNPKEINFNPLISNSEVLNSNPFSGSLFASMESDLNYDNANNNNINMNLMNTPRLSISSSTTTTTTNNNNMNISNDPTVLHNFNNDELTELFNDQFLNDIGSLVMESVNNTSMLGLHRGLTSEMLLNNNDMNINNAVRATGGLQTDTVAGTGTVGNGDGNGEIVNLMFNSGLYNLRNNSDLNNQLPSSSSTTQFLNLNYENNHSNNNSGGNKGNELYNSLNEIDFTNVDFNSGTAPGDNLVYGFDIGNNVVNNSGTDNNNGNDGNGLGDWNFF